MTISVRVLDATGGRPVFGLPVSLHRQGNGGDWSCVARTRTDDRGSVGSFTARPLPEGTYRLVFATGEYFDDQGADALYTEIVLTLHYPGNAACLHIPLFLSPFSYATCRATHRSVHRGSPAVTSEWPANRAGDRIGPLSAGPGSPGPGPLDVPGRGECPAMP